MNRTSILEFANALDLGPPDPSSSAEWLNWTPYPADPRLSVNARGEIRREYQTRAHRAGSLVTPWKLAPANRYLVFKLGRKRLFVHVVVCETFHGPRPEGMMALHRDDNSHNNEPSNLYWGTSLNNANDQVANRGGDHQFVGRNNPNYKLTSSDVAGIRRMLARSDGLRKIARVYGVTHSTITAIRDGRTHKNG